MSVRVLSCLAAQVPDMSATCPRMSSKSPILRRHVECRGHHANLAICRACLVSRAYVFCSVHIPIPHASMHTRAATPPNTTAADVTLPDIVRRADAPSPARASAVMSGVRGALFPNPRAPRSHNSSPSSLSSASSFSSAAIKTTCDPHVVRFDDCSSSIVAQIAASWQGEHAALW